MAKTITTYPKRGKPSPVHFDIIGKTPAPEDISKLQNGVNRKKAVSGAEAKDALLWFFAGIVAAPLLWLFGRWVINEFVGPGVLFFGYGAAYIGAPGMVIFGLISFARLFRSAQKTNPEDALRWIFEVAYIGDAWAGTRFSKPEYALGTLRRAVHDAMGFNEDAARTYIAEFRNALTSAMDVTALPAKKEFGGAEGSPQKEMKIENRVEISPGVVEMKATMAYTDILTKSDQKNTYNMVSAILELHIALTLIRSGKYWYLYDIYPSVTQRGPTQAAQLAETDAAAKMNT